MYVKSFIAFVAATAMMGTCVGGLASTTARYYIGFVNKTGRDLKGVLVYYGSAKAGGKENLVKGGMATEGIITLPFPQEADVRWFENGQPHSVKVKLEGMVSNSFAFDGTLYFFINSDGTVQAKVIKGNDKAAKAELWKGLRPEGEYRLGFVNKTGRDLQAVSAYYGDHKVGTAGDIPARTKVGYSDPLTLVFPSEAEVRWTETGVPHSAKAKLEHIVPKGYAEGTVFFVIGDADTVEVKPIKWSDNEGSIKLLK